MPRPFRTRIVGRESRTPRTAAGIEHGEGAMPTHRIIHGEGPLLGSPAG